MGMRAFVAFLAGAVVGALAGGFAVYTWTTPRPPHAAVASATPASVPTDTRAAAPRPGITQPPSPEAPPASLVPDHEPAARDEPPASPVPMAVGDVGDDDLDYLA